MSVMEEREEPELGLMIAGAGAGSQRFASAGALAARAEAAGFTAVWAGELYDRSATVMLATLASATSRCTIGSAMAYAGGRSPLVLAAEARDLDALSDGRLVLGLGTGTGTATMMRDWLGISPQAPAARLEELVTLLRSLWRLDGTPVDHAGRFYRMRLTPATASIPFRERLPVFIAGVNPRMVEVAGRVGDGLLGHPMFTARYLDEVVRPAIARGAARAGRETARVAVTRTLMCAVDEDLDRARRRIAFAIAQYGASRVYERLFALHGWSPAQRELRDAARRGDGEGMAAAVPDAAIDAIGIACAPGELRERVARHAARGDRITLTAPSWGLGPEETAAAAHRIVDEVRPRSLA
jgi:probable F420-dependent oxidoreductase